MPKEYSRKQRVGDAIQRELAVLIQQEMQDPRLQLITVTAVEVSSDLAYAKVYITQHKDESEIPQTLKVLNKAAGRLRYLLGKNIKLRIVPQLKFVYDASIVYANHLSTLIDEAIEQDEKNQHE